VGQPKKYHQYVYQTWYDQLLDTLRQELDAYMRSFKSEDIMYRRTINMECSDFLLYMQHKGKTSICEINYDDVTEYFYCATDRKDYTKARYVSQARALLQFYCDMGMIKRSLCFTLDTLFIHQIVSLGDFDDHDIEKLNNLRYTSLDFPADEMWEAVTEFIKVLEEHNYKTTCKRTSKHVLTLLFIFLEKHNFGYLPEIAQIWFVYEKPLLLSNWKMGRKTLLQFEEFTKEGNITIEHWNYYKPRKIDFLPGWCKDTIEEFLALKRRAFMKKSTIDMYRSAIVRLCEFLVKQGMHSFEELTAENLTQFNLEDKHSTPEGKNAYNVRIRNFLIFLEEEGYIDNVFIHGALLCVFAPRERVVNVLNSNEVADIYDYNNTAEGSYELRRAAMILIGLKMGLRGSDIVNLKFSDIDWKSQTIRLIQEKTLVEELLPMPVIVGNAIFKYITRGRPSGKSSYIFIHHKVPYGKLTPSVCRAALSAAIPKKETSGNGFHVTRRTFATNLLNAGTDIGLIIDALGHHTDSTVNKYLSLDEKRMAMCPLSFEETGIPMLGGEFYC